MQRERAARVIRALREKRAQMQRDREELEGLEDIMDEAEKYADDIRAIEEIIRNKTWNAKIEFSEELVTGIVVGESSCEIFVPEDIWIDMYRR